MEYIFIGSKFYYESSTAMSPVYKIEKDGSLSRSDWGFVEIDLENGETVHIRPATTIEMEYFEDKLEEYKRRQ